MRKRHRWSRTNQFAAASISAACVVALTGCAAGHSPAKSNPDTGPLTFTSAAFARNGVMPISYGCTGANTSPPLSWHGVAPAGTKSWAIVMQDLDVTPAPWIQWVLSGIPLQQRAALEGQTPPGASAGVATNGTPGFVGACPPEGKVHHYQFTLYALGVNQPIPPASPPARSLHTLETTALAKLSLTARFGR